MTSRERLDVRVRCGVARRVGFQPARNRRQAGSLPYGQQIVGTCPCDCVILVALLAGLPLHGEDLGLKVPPGFRVTLWADHTLANDIFTMALDEKGRVVVSGPGYIRRLEDTDGDGKADKAINIAETKTGAMGLCFGRGGPAATVERP